MNRLVLIGVLVSVVLIVLLIWLIRTRRLQERHALLWLAGAVVIVALGVSSGALEAFSDAIGIAYPPSALFLIVVAFLGIALLDSVVTISRLTDKVRRLAQRVAVLDERLETLTRAAELEARASSDLNGSTAERSDDEHASSTAERPTGPDR